MIQLFENSTPSSTKNYNFYDSSIDVFDCKTHENRVKMALSKTQNLSYHGFYSKFFFF